jgi:hypothetical protein
MSKKYINPSVRFSYFQLRFSSRVGETAVNRNFKLLQKFSGNFRSSSENIIITYLSPTTWYTLPDSISVYYLVFFCKCPCLSGVAKYEWRSNVIRFVPLPAYNTFSFYTRQMITFAE